MLRAQPARTVISTRSLSAFVKFKDYGSSLLIAFIIFYLDASKCGFPSFSVKGGFFRGNILNLIGLIFFSKGVLSF